MRHCRSATLLLLAFTSCAHGPQPIVGFVAIPGMAGVEAAQRASHEGRLLEGLQLIHSAQDGTPGVAEAAKPVAQELEQRALVEVERLHALKQIDAYELAVPLLAAVAKIDPMKKPEADALQREFDDYLWKRLHESDPPRVWSPPPPQARPPF